MDRAHDCSMILVGHVPQELDALCCRYFVQPCRGFVQKENTGIGDHLQANREPFTFAATQLLGRETASVVQVESTQDIRDHLSFVHVHFFALQLACDFHQFLYGQLGLMYLLLGQIAGSFSVDLDRSIDVARPGRYSSHRDIQKSVFLYIVQKRAVNGLARKWHLLCKRPQHI